MKKIVLKMASALICGMLFAGCSSKMTMNDNSELIEKIPDFHVHVNFDGVRSDCSPYELMFVNTSDYAFEYLWDFGDGHTSTEKEPIHTFPEAGIYCITLTLVFGEDMSQSLTKPVTVYSLPLVDESSEVIADFEYVSASCTNKVMFINTSKNDIAYLWDFGNGYTSTQREPEHTYMKSGTYNVTLNVVGEKDVMSRVSVTKPIVINFGIE